MNPRFHICVEHKGRAQGVTPYKDTLTTGCVLEDMSQIIQRGDKKSIP